mgnify:CR=1 FL=1
MAAVPTHSNTLKGIACMIGGVAILTLNDGVMKWMTASYPVGEIIFIRGLFVLMVVALFAWRAGGLGALRIHDVRGQAVRALFTIASTGFFVTSLRFLPMAESIAITFASPLFVTALAPSLLGEGVGWRRWLAVCVGFCGVLLILRPGTEMFSSASILPVLAAFMMAIYGILTRYAARRDAAETSFFWTAMAGGIAMLCVGPFFWLPPVGSDW